MNVFQKQLQGITRRHFLHGGTAGLGAIALSSLLAGERAQATPTEAGPGPLSPRPSHHPARAKNVIYLHMAGSPPQQELFDFKPKLRELNDQDCPDEFLEGERFAFIKGHPQLLGSPYEFAHHGQSGLMLSELLPNLGEVADDLCVIKSMWTDQFNHAPAQLMLYTGTSQFGKPSMGSWVTYGLGSENQDLPGFVVLVSGDKVPSAGKSVWGSGFLPSVFQGVQCRTSGEPVLYVTNPKGMDRAGRRRSLDAIRDLNEMQLAEVGDPETLTRIEQYELAYRMQVSVPEVMDISSESVATHAMYGSDPSQPSFANNCLLARRMVESGVRFVQLFDWGWDVHGTGKTTDLISQLPKKCRQTERPIAALITDLKQRGLLDETLIVWSGEFGRTPMNEKRDNSKFLGRDHHPHSMSMFMAGGGVKGGFSYGATDELGYFATENRMFVNDLQATILHLLGLDPYEFHVPYQGLKQRLIGPTEDPKIHHDLIA
ncbi:MAG: DUF1501 domain-containing protein [Planctomycetota bacterium]|nr:MAG: DUF1501 domain-containing protein [Planctomycetota bacterium]REJ90064.1 MAG: DUF1501 domain-containing protein [Planctomycetota bacterium]REK23144.1 MAG: DUF1501 domain-containing protein [Planctomycetota bacterium]REK43419.1 MAG: DUF1501 domain-containing protein [Planctomycetota bacterium]